MVQTGDPSQSAPDNSATLQRSQMLLSPSPRPDAAATPRYDVNSEICHYPGVIERLRNLTSNICHKMSAVLIGCQRIKFSFFKFLIFELRPSFISCRFTSQHHSFAIPLLRFACVRASVTMASSVSIAC